jgi:polyferredoxin
MFRDTIRKRINNMNLNRFRFLFQLGTFVLLVYGGYVGFDLGDKLPTFACVYNSDGSGGKCFLGNFQHDLKHPLGSFAGFEGFALLVTIGVFIAWLILFNKSWCGFACPLGTMQDWITSLRSRLKIGASEYSWHNRRRIQSIKYVLLVLLIIIPPLIVTPVFGLPTLPNGLSMPFCDICPGRMLIPLFTGDYHQFYIDFSTKTDLVMTTLGMTLTGLLIAGAFIKKRFFCYFCPMSALHYVFSRTSLFQLKKDGERCTRCGDCYRACDMDIIEIAEDVESSNLVTEDCSLCLKCIAACPEEGCLEATFAGQTFFESTKEGFILRMAMERSDHEHEAR